MFIPYLKDMRKLKFKGITNIKVNKWIWRLKIDGEYYVNEVYHLFI